MHKALALDRADHGGHFGLVAIGTHADDLATLVVDAFQMAEKAFNEVGTRPLAVGDDMDAAIFLKLERQQGGVCLAPDQRCVGTKPAGV